MSALQWHRVAGRSMWPLGPPLQAGVRQVPAVQLSQGDVIVFIAGEDPALWLHRVVRIEAEGVITRGDANGFDDPRVPFSAILGRVEALRLGAFVVPVAQSGVLARLRREVGVAWSRIAPRLLRVHRRRKSRAKTRDDP